MPRATRTEAPPDFDQALAELESIVQQLDSGTLSLDKSLALFQRGVELARVCKKKLDEAEFAVKTLVETKDGLFEEQAFGPEEPDDDTVA